MESINFYSFEERVPSHKEKIYLLERGGQLKRALVSYPSRDEPSVYKDSHYEVSNIYGEPLPYEKHSFYCTKDDLSPLLNEANPTQEDK